MNGMRGIRALRSSSLRRCSLSSTGRSKSAVDFSDTQTAFAGKSLWELSRGILVFSLCRLKPLVNHAEPLLKASYRLLGSTITNKVLQASFFGHFCAGEDELSIKPVIEKLEQHGVGSILDYAAESDLEDASDPVSVPVEKVKAVGRVYDYKNEQLCDQHMETFEKAIISVKNVSPTGFAAIKVTALGNPELLRRVSSTLTEVRRLFHELDRDQKGVISKEAFLKTFGTKVEGQDVLQHFARLDVDGDGQVDYIEWTNGLKLEELSLLTAHCTEQGPLALSVLNEEELRLLQRMRERLLHLVELAQSKGVRLMIDAEHSYFQPAIDQLTTDLARRFNRPNAFPVVFSTYQMYLLDSTARLLTDMDRARKGGYKFAAKLVRGAYMVIERQHAKEHGLVDPIHASIEVTHANYNAAVQETLNRIAQGHDIEIMMATHNQDSVAFAVRCMEEHGLQGAASGVYFGQLLGMADHLTFCLAASGFKAYKYVPYGKVNEVMPYLIRRAQENSDALGGAKLALDMSRNELSRRLRA